jgi:hypothetical protein
VILLLAIPVWLIWATVVCAAFIVGFFLGALVSADAAMAAAKRDSEDELWHD